MGIKVLYGLGLRLPDVRTWYPPGVWRERGKAIRLGDLGRHISIAVCREMKRCKEMSGESSGWLVYDVAIR